MSDTDFNIDELLDFEEKLMKRINTDMPDKSAKMLDKVAGNMRERLEDNTPLSEKEKPRSKRLKYRWRKANTKIKKGALQTKVFNGVPHAYVYENGHIAENGKFVKGSHLLEQEVDVTEKEIVDEARKLIDEVFGD